MLTKRTDSLDFLHPTVREAATKTIADLETMGITFRVFETYRSPERQNMLKAKRPKVTNARAWQSMHQYGLAVDFVIKKPGVNPWSTKNGFREWWSKLHEVGELNGLEPLRNKKGQLIELPHMGLKGWRWKDCWAGAYPANGDDTWVWNLHQAAMRHPKGAPKILPDYPEDVLECRPPLDHLADV